MIIESVLMGEETKEKYEIEGYEFNWWFIQVIDK